ncbi:MAG: rod shape-determining protein MreD [Ruminococcus sp.]|nr:rod shape-determining protein MreD [Ruminococcus sp.]
MDRKFTIVRYIAFGIEILILFILQSTPNLIPEVFGGRPLLLIPAAITIAYFEPEIPAMFYGIACGILLDLGYSEFPGYYTIMLGVICFLLGWIFRDYMVVSFFNATAFSAVIITGVIGINFLFFYVFAGKGEAGMYFLTHYVSKIIYTFLCGIVLYFINKGLFRSLLDY